jgi:hypothetical protein
MGIRGIGWIKYLHDRACEKQGIIQHGTLTSAFWSVEENARGNKMSDSDMQNRYALNRFC